MLQIVLMIPIIIVNGTRCIDEVVVGANIVILLLFRRGWF